MNTVKANQVMTMDHLAADIVERQNTTGRSAPAHLDHFVIGEHRLKRTVLGIDSVMRQRYGSLVKTSNVSRN